MGIASIYTHLLFGVYRTPLTNFCDPFYECVWPKIWILRWIILWILWILLQFFYGFCDTPYGFLWSNLWTLWSQKDGAKVVNISAVGYEFSMYLLIFLVEVINFSGPRYIFVVFINNEILFVTNFCGSKYENLYIPF